MRDVFCFLLVLAAIFYPGSGMVAEPMLISLEVQNETLGETLGQVSQISGYTIYLHPQWRDIPITIRLQNLPLEKAVLKILNNRINYAIIWDETEKSISITGVKIARRQQMNPGNNGQGKGINGQGIRFEQASRTTEY